MHLLKDENGNIIPHGAEHTHEHSHEDGHTHTHPHTHEHGHEDDHHHDHEHGCEGSCDTGCSGCSGAAQDPKAQLTALLGYMLNHNAVSYTHLDVYKRQELKSPCPVYCYRMGDFFAKNSCFFDTEGV